MFSTHKRTIVAICLCGGLVVFVFVCLVSPRNDPAGESGKTFDPELLALFGILEALHDDTSIPRNSKGGQYEPMHQRIDPPLNEITSHKMLAAAFYECEQRGRAHAGNRYDDPCPYFLASTAILFRLSELKDDDSVRSLVEIYADESVDFDGESALNVLHAISICGKPAIKYLRSIQGERMIYAQAVIDAIERGELYGP